MPVSTRPTTSDPETDPNLDRGWAWLILLSALLTHILTFGLAYASIGAFYVELLHEFGQSESATAWTGSILLGVMLCSGPLSSVFVAKCGTMVTAITGGALASGGLALSALAPKLTYLYFTFGVITGLGFGFSYLPSIVMLGKFFEQRRSMACGLAVSGSGVGTFIFAPLTQHCMKAFGWRATFLILGGCCLILCCCGATYQTRKLPKKFQHAEGKLAIHASSSSVLMFFSDVTSVTAEPLEPAFKPSSVDQCSEKDAETQTVITCVADQRSPLGLSDGTQYNTSNNAICEGYHCQPAVYNVDGTLRDTDVNHSNLVPFGSPVQTDTSKIYRASSPTTSAFDMQISHHQQQPIIITENEEPARLEEGSSTSELVDQSGPSRRFQLGRYLGQCPTFSHLLKNHFFILFCLSNFVMCIGYQLPYMYFKAFALSLNVSENDWSYILSIMGITDMIGRIIVGCIFDKITSGYGRLFGFMCASILSGIFLFLLSFSTEFNSLTILASCYSLLAGSTDSLVPALLAHFVGIDTLAYSFGMVIEMQGSGFLIGPPIAGALYRMLGEQYQVVFFTGGISFILAGCILTLQPVLARIKTVGGVCNRCRH